MAKENEKGTSQSQQDMKNYRQSLRDLPKNITTKLKIIKTSEDLEKEYPTELTIDKYTSKV